MTKDNLINYLINEAEYSIDDVMRMGDYELLDAYLTYNGIIGFTDDIVDVIKALNIEFL